MSGLRWGLIGASDIAATRMIPSMRRLGQDPVAVLSGSAERGERYARMHGVAVVCTDLDEILGRSDIDAVYVSTTNDLHAPQTIAAAGAGKHVLCEKPLALSLSDAEAMVDACERAGVVFATNHHLPCAGPHRRIAELVAAGAVGRPLAARVFHAVYLPDRLQGWRLTEPGRGGGVILDITCHDAAALRAILGREALAALAAAVGQGAWDAQVEDAVMTVLRFEDNVLAQTHDAFTVAHAGTGLEVHGTDGSIICTNAMAQDPVGEIVVRDRSGERSVTDIDRRDLYDVALDAFAAAVEAGGRPIVDGVDGLKALAIALAVKESSASGRVVPVKQY